MKFIDFKDFKSQEEVSEIFNNEEYCVAQLETLRWNDDIVSPFDETSKIYKCKQGKYRCRNTGKYFNVKTHTIFHNTKIELAKWFQAIWITTNYPNITAIDLSKKIEVTPKTAWLMQKRIAKYVRTQTSAPVTKQPETPSQLAITDWLTQLK
ncbi:hypothetical protein HUK80_10600 [Flavobacterium sp. MAH-1]|uniref:Transposase zinc-ribbon domain-containing protein n=1 Tax=Flavobacterium agri TaxID=2743471 RepID=A0A7Y9C5J6_9FLAO|nr:hypothetical protein [Flavobacterium agri]NUY81347.1 hypothetical protein [Flavobacterium agri]NYA71371.1 hypothetical protein [Flavobacterium agri]